MSKIKTAFWLIKNRGLRNTFWYSIRSFYHLLSRNEREQFLKNSTLSSAEVGGATLNFHPSRKGVSEVVGVYGVHEPLTTEVYLNHIEQGDKIVEIGANIGYYALLARSAVGDSGRVLGFEPVPDNIEVLTQNVAGFENIQIFNTVVTNEIGEVDFFVSEIPNWGTLIDSGDEHITSKIKIPSVTLDQAIANLDNFEPDMIHMDIEGGEILAFEGAWQTIEKYRPKIFVEFHPFATGYEPVKKLLKTLQEIGYDRCLYLDRTIDEPWVPQWIRKLRMGNSSLAQFINRLNRNNCSPNFTILIEFTE